MRISSKYGDYKLARFGTESDWDLGSALIEAGRWLNERDEALCFMGAMVTADEVTVVYRDIEERWTGVAADSVSPRLLRAV